MSKEVRRIHSPAHKIALLKRHVVGKEPISAICTEHAIRPSVFYYWQRQLLGNAARAARGEGQAAPTVTLEARLAKLEAELTQHERRKRKVGRP